MCKVSVFVFEEEWEQWCFVGCVFFQFFDGFEDEGIHRVLVVVPIERVVFKDFGGFVVVHDAPAVDFQDEFFVVLETVLLLLGVCFEVVGVKDFFVEIFDERRFLAPLLLFVFQEVHHLLVCSQFFNAAVGGEESVGRGVFGGDAGAPFACQSHVVACGCQFPEFEKSGEEVMIQVLRFFKREVQFFVRGFRVFAFVL